MLCQIAWLVWSDLQSTRTSQRLERSSEIVSGPVTALDQLVLSFVRCGFVFSPTERVEGQGLHDPFPILRTAIVGRGFFARTHEQPALLVGSGIPQAARDHQSPARLVFALQDRSPAL